MRTRLVLLIGSVVAIVLAVPATFAPPAFAQVTNCAGQPDGTACDDGNLCTYGDACKGGGTCSGWAITCTSDACATRACNGTSTCSVLSAAPDGTACNDGNVCTTGETCKAGGCAAMLVDNGLRVDRLAAGSATSVITWNLPLGAVGSDVVRGSVSCLPVSPTGVCETSLAQLLNGSTSVQDSGVPAPGTAYWYLVRGEADTEGCPGPWGFETAHGLATIRRVSNGGCVPNANISPRYVSNGLTVTDWRTCLEWEKKTTTVGVNNVNDLYTWSQSGNAPNGTAFSVFLPTLNAGRFARHAGWRLPSEDACNTCWSYPSMPFQCSCPPLPAELEAIYPATDPLFGSKASNYYWSSSGVAFGAGEAWAVYFGSGSQAGSADTIYRTIGLSVRAVRGGP